MNLSLIRRETEARRECRSAGFWRCGRAYRAGMIICVLLVFLTSFVAVTHVHLSADDAAAPDHSCSLCALAHTGIAVNNIVIPVPIFAPTIVADIQAPALSSSLLVFSYYIRPPPAA